MTTLYKYQIYCVTEDTYVYTWAEEEPDKCPNDTSHTIDPDRIMISESINASPTTPEGYPVIHMDAPQEVDKRLVVVNSPIPEKWMIWFAGAGDDETNGRGKGTQLDFDFTGTGLVEKDLEFIEPVWLHDGELFYYPTANWKKEDRFDLSVVMPATEVVANGSGEGNCYLVDTGFGFNVILPADQDGTHDVNLEQAVPVPAGIDIDGFWDVDFRTGQVTPSSTPGSAQWHLYDAPLQSYFMRNMPMGNPIGVYSIDAYKAEWISERWTLRVSINRATDSAAEAAAWMLFFREKTQ